MYKFASALVFTAFISLFPQGLAAQEINTFIGSSSFTKQQFSCVTYPGGEDIEVTTKGKTRILDKAVAKRQAQSSLEKLLDKLDDTRADLKAAKALVKRLLNSPLLALPKTAKELERAKKRVAKLQAKLATLKGQKGELKSLIAAINDCGKIPPLTNGSNLIRSGTIDLPISGWQGYLISAMHVFAYHPSMGDRICVSLDGGPRVQVGVRFNSCTTFNDGPGTGKPVPFCTETLGAGQGALILGGRAGYFHLGNYEEDLQAVQALLSKQLDLSLNSAENPCPR